MEQTGISSRGVTKAAPINPSALYPFFVLLQFLIVELRMGYRWEITFRIFWQRHFVFPIAFWIITFAFALLSEFRWKEEDTWRRVLKIGLLTHAYLLVAQFLGSGAYESLNSPVYSYYCKGSSFLFLSLVTGYGIRKIREWQGAEGMEQGLFFLPLSLLFILPSPQWITIFFIGFLMETISRRVKKEFLSLNPTILLGIIFTLGVLIRVAAARRLYAMGLNTVLLNSDDAQAYIIGARKILSGIFIGNQYSPGASAFFALMLKLTGASVSRALMLQAVLLATPALAIYFVGKKLFNIRVGLVAAALIAFSQLLIFNSVNITREGPAHFCFAWFLCLTVYVDRKMSFTRGMLVFSALGVCSSFLCVVEPVFQPFVLGAVLVLLWKCESSKGNKFLLFLGFLVGFLAVKVAFDSIILGKVDFLGRKLSQGVHVACEFNVYATELCARGLILIKDPVHFFAGWIHHPLEISRLLFLKVVRDFVGFFFEPYSGEFDPTLLVRSSYLASNLAVYGYLFAFGGLFAVLRSLKEQTAQKISLLLLTFGYAILYIVVFFGVTRFRANIQPALLILVAYGMVWLLETRDSSVTRLS